MVNSTKEFPPEVQWEAHLHAARMAVEKGDVSSVRRLLPIFESRLPKGLENFLSRKNEMLKKLEAFLSSRHLTRHDNTPDGGVSVAMQLPEEIEFGDDDTTADILISPELAFKHAEEKIIEMARRVKSGSAKDEIIEKLRELFGVPELPRNSRHYPKHEMTLQIGGDEYRITLRAINHNVFFDSMKKVG